MKERIKKIIMNTLSGLKIPTYLFLLFWFAGVGFSLGVGQSKMYNELLNGKSIIITSFDLRSDEDDSNCGEEACG